jgi:branched-chain amino acid transport system ATP-binding protein
MSARRTAEPNRAGQRLTVRQLVCRFGGVTAVDGVTLTVPPGRITALSGPNGAGKSTLFDCLSGAQRPDSGRILLAGRDITRLSAHQRARLGLARTFQQIAVFPRLTVAENLRVGAEQAGGLTRDAASAAVERTLALLGLRSVRDRPAAALPGGTLRLVELGRALAAGPGVLLLDEPAAGLDRAETDRLARLLRALADNGLAVLLVEHDRELVDRIADAGYTMAHGRAGPRTALPGSPASPGRSGGGA